LSATSDVRKETVGIGSKRIEKRESTVLHPQVVDGVIQNRQDITIIWVELAGTALSSMKCDG
jgi:hypothetical protein